MLEVQTEPKSLDSKSNIFQYTFLFLSLFYGTIWKIISSVFNLIINSREKSQVIPLRNKCSHSLLHSTFTRNKTIPKANV